MDRRLELEAWIARTQGNQRKLTRGLTAGAVIAMGLMLWQLQIGMIALAIVGIVAICGFWILSSHIVEWRSQLAQLDRPPRRVGRRA